MAPFFLVFKAKKPWASASFRFSSPIHNGMLHSAGPRHGTEWWKNLEFEDEEKEVWRESAEEDEAE